MNKIKKYYNLNNKKEYYSLDTALEKGTIYPSIYKKYKYDNIKIVPENEQERLTLEINRHQLFLIDLNLYLDVNPNDQEALDMYNTYLEKNKELVNKYEEKYGALSTSSEYLKSIPFKYLTSDWPWGDVIDV